MTIPLPVRSEPARVPGQADAAALTLVLSHADVAALRRQLALLIAPEPYGEGNDARCPVDELRLGLPPGLPRAGGAAGKP
jgi:hypothetical protein